MLPWQLFLYENLALDKREQTLEKRKVTLKKRGILSRSGNSLWRSTSLFSCLLHAQNENLLARNNTTVVIGTITPKANRVNLAVVKRLTELTLTKGLSSKRRTLVDKLYQCFSFLQKK